MPNKSAHAEIHSDRAWRSTASMHRFLWTLGNEPRRCGAEASS